MAEVEMTETNPMGKRPGRKSLSDYTFNVNEIERSLTQGGGALSKKQKQTIGNLRKLDRDGDGDISLIEILSLEEDAERAQKDANRLRKIVCGIVIGIIFCLGCIMCMGIAAIEITKESRVRGGTPVATPGSSAALPASSSERRRLGGRGLINPASTIGEKWDKPVAMEPPMMPEEPKDPIDVSMEAKYMAMEGMTGKEKDEAEEG